MPTRAMAAAVARTTRLLIHPVVVMSVMKEADPNPTLLVTMAYIMVGPPVAAAAAAAVPDTVADEIADPAVEVACLWGYWWWGCRGLGGCSDSDPGGHISWKTSEFSAPCNIEHMSLPRKSAKFRICEYL